MRFYGKLLQDRVGKTVIVENKAGAFGNIATEYVAKSKPDGYTLFIAPGSSFLAAAPQLFKKLPFDPVNDFEHITTLSKLPFLLVVPGDSPYQDGRRSDRVSEGEGRQGFVRIGRKYRPRRQ